MSYQNDRNRQNRSYEHSEDYSALISNCVPSFPVEKACEEFAKAIVDSRKLSSAQLRRFYNDFKALERKYEVVCLNTNEKSEAFSSLLPQIKITKAKVAYAKARKTIPDVFEKWLQKSVDAINDHESFEKFLLHFEAVVGYAYGAGLKD